MATTQLQIVRDVAGYPQTLSDCARIFTNTGEKFTLTATTVTSITVPATAEGPLLAFFRFTPVATVWVQLGSTPTLILPTGTPAATTAALNPSGRRVMPGQTIQFLTNDANVSVGVEYYQTPS